MAEALPSKPEAAGVPAWVMTFADLMTLLMCFFVLLLSFSEMDAARFKLLSGSMKDAFGVQTQIEARTIPKGTSVIAREFSPGTPEPTPLNVVNQFTLDSSQNSLDAAEREKLERDKKAREDTEKHAKSLKIALKDEIDNGDVAIQTEGAKVIIHVLENASFDSGSADIRPEFVPVLRKIAELIQSTNGAVNVSGHTDNVPISTDRFRSNWELSTSRAVSVAHELLQWGHLDESRFVVTGHADTVPRADNSTPENRAKNRRVDISIVRGGELDTVRGVSIGDEQLNSTLAEESSP